MAGLGAASHDSHVVLCKRLETQVAPRTAPSYINTALVMTIFFFLILFLLFIDDNGPMERKLTRLVDMQIDGDGRQLGLRISSWLPVRPRRRFTLQSDIISC